MERIVVGFLDQPSFLSIAPFVEYSKREDNIQNILPLASLVKNVSNTQRDICQKQESCHSFYKTKRLG